MPVQSDRLDTIKRARFTGNLRHLLTDATCWRLRDTFYAITKDFKGYRPWKRGYRMYITYCRTMSTGKTKALWIPHLHYQVVGFSPLFSQSLAGYTIGWLHEIIQLLVASAISSVSFAALRGCVGGANATARSPEAHRCWHRHLLSE